jgi:hypothetical protein
MENSFEMIPSLGCIGCSRRASTLFSLVNNLNCDSSTSTVHRWISGTLL